MLLTLHHCQQYKKKGGKQAAKFFPHYDGPYDVVDSHAETSNYTLELPNAPNTFPTFHAFKLKPFIPNDPTLFPGRELSQLLPILTPDSLEEFHVQEILNSRRHGRGIQYLICWVGYGPKHNHWLTGSTLEDCEALDVWQDKEASDSATR